MVSKDAPQKMQSLGAIKKVASLGAVIQNAKVAEKLYRFGRHRGKIGPNRGVGGEGKIIAKRDPSVCTGNSTWECIV